MNYEYEWRLNDLRDGDYHNDLLFWEDWRPVRAVQDDFRDAKESFSKTENSLRNSKLDLIDDEGIIYREVYPAKDEKGFGFLGIKW